MPEIDWATDAWSVGGFTAIVNTNYGFVGSQGTLTSTNVDGSGIDVALTFTEGDGDNTDGGEEGFGGWRFSNDIDDFGQADNSSLQLNGIGDANGSETSTVQIQFQDSGNPTDVDGAQFRINDFDTNDWDDTLTIQAFDAAGNPVEIFITPENGNLITVSGDATNGYAVDTVATEGTNTNTTNASAAGSILFQIPAEVATIVIDYGNLGAGGQQITVTNVTFDDATIVCFVKGTMIETDLGAKAIENLVEGDRIWTKDMGYQALRWVGSSQILARGKLAPIRIRAGALGNETDLWVSPEHRMLISGWRSELLFGQQDILVAAKHLIDDKAIRREESDFVCYYHLLFDDHQIIKANGAFSESLYPGPVALKSLSAEAKREVCSIFPELNDHSTDKPLVREELCAWEARSLNAMAL
ncbi:MAG: Hint domain-containing protein [Pseudomonadota bacterium]